MFRLIFYNLRKIVCIYREPAFKIIISLLTPFLILCLSAAKIYPATFLAQEKMLELSGERTGLEEIIRFHVKAHSDGPQDQKIKNELAEMLMSVYGPSWRNCENSSELRLMLVKNVNVMEETAQLFLQEKGIPHEVCMSLEKRFFPARSYADEFYPAGEYETFYVTIGEGAGENWWCVLFPPLCFSIFPVKTDGQQRNDIYPGTGEVLRDEHQFGKPNSSKWCFWLVEIFQK